MLQLDLVARHALLHSEGHPEPVKQLQLHWQHCSLTAASDQSLKKHLPSSLDIWSLLASSLTKALPGSDEFDQSDAAMMTALAFTTEVLKHPFQMVDNSARAGLALTVTACPADQALPNLIKV